jgi:hypothetical protein
MPKSTSLSITLPGVPAGRTEARNGLASPRTPLTPRSPRSPPVLNHGGHLGLHGEYAEGYDVHVHSPINALPPPPSPRSPKHKGSKIFSNMKASKSSTKINKTDSPARMPNQSTDAAASQVYSLRVAGKSSPDLVNLYSDGQPSPQHGECSPSDFSTYRNADNFISESYDLDDRKDGTVGKDNRKRDKHKFGHILGRKASVKADEELPRSEKPPTPVREGKQDTAKLAKQTDYMSMKTAPLEKERGFRSAMNSALRNRSLDRQQNESEEEGKMPPPVQPSSRQTQNLGSNGLPSGNSSSFLHNIRSSGSRAADGVNRARKGIFGKLTRSGSSHEREPLPKEPYELKVINLPLVQQTRLTRISKRLEKSKDKTEFWMPALPWRCIDYLNLHGTTSEGLYRVPGSDRDIRHWQMRFDKGERFLTCGNITIVIDPN